MSQPSWEPTPDTKNSIIGDIKRCVLRIANRDIQDSLIEDLESNPYKYLRDSNINIREYSLFRIKNFS